jgi:hypothetical protein
MCEFVRLQVAQEQEERDDDQDQREHLAEQDPAEPELAMIPRRGET